MKKQVLVINGGSTFDSYRDFILFYKRLKIDPEKIKVHNDWKNLLQKELGAGFDVYVPRMPNSQNAKYSEWKMFFERIIPILRNNVILVGHSLGGVFLAKYLSENKFPKKIKATILVAAPFNDLVTGESLGSFQLKKNISRFGKQGGAIYIFQSADDPVVPQINAARYLEALPGSRAMMFRTRKHFNQSSFPELTRVIQSI